MGRRLCSPRRPKIYLSSSPKAGACPLLLTERDGTGPQTGFRSTHTPGLSSPVSTDLPTLARVSNPLKPQPPPQPHGTVRVTDRNDVQKAPGPAAPAPTTPYRAENTRASGHPRSFPLLPAPCVRVPSHPGWPPLDGRVFWRDQITGGREKGMPDQRIHRSHCSDSETQSAFKFPDLLVPYPTSQL